MYLEKNRSRAQTRYNLEKKKKKCRNYWWWSKDSESAEEQRMKVGKAAQTPKICSCWMCGNPRKHQNLISLKEYEFSSRKDVDLYLKYGE